MEVILIERIEKLGNIGDTVQVRDGYARNFLIPQSKALRATKDNKAYFESRKAEIEAANAQKRQDAEAQATKLANLSIIMIRQAGEDGRLFGSVTSRDIALAVNEAKSVDVEKKAVILGETIKYTGIYTAKIALHSEVSIPVEINVARSESEAIEAKNKGYKGPVRQDADREEEPSAETAAAEEDTSTEAAASEGKEDTEAA